MHIGAKKGQKFNGEELRNIGPGHGRVSKRDEASYSFNLSIEGALVRLGVWWLDAAARGGPALLPVVNTAPVFADCHDAGAVAALQAAATPKLAGCRDTGAVAALQAAATGKPAKVMAAAGKGGGVRARKEKLSANMVPVGRAVTANRPS
mmetsp:Transcript_27089/g.63281  ORF Transcript_27089/g.63281 Transcript_27089/m.63281 type:complete len:150 (-) Transcript_27089:179-628(-)